MAKKEKKKKKKKQDNNNVPDRREAGEKGISISKASNSRPNGFTFLVFSGRKKKSIPHRLFLHDIPLYCVEAA